MQSFNKTLYNIRLALSYKDIVSTRIKPVFNYKIQKAHRQFIEAMRSLGDKKTIEVAFFISIPGMWKSDYVFRLMKESSKYHPYVVILPYSSFKGFMDSETEETLLRTENFIRSKGYEYIIPYNKTTNQWEDIKLTRNPDIVFYSSPYKDNLPAYYVYNYLDKGTFYIPYGFITMNTYSTQYNLVFPNLVGCNLVETEMHLSFAKKYGRSNGKNYAVVGFPSAEAYMREDYRSKDVWKSQDRQKKRIIWAPHHSIDAEGGLDVSTFLKYYEDMFRLAEEFADKIQFAFKPHQTLKYKLELLWGKEKTYEYYHRWETLGNGQLEESEYTDLFIHSDAMIHDSGAFTTEYLFVHKPVMYLVKNNNIRKQFNDFGIKSFEQHYQGHCIDDIKQFIREVVLAGNDPMKEQREIFFNEYLKSKDNQLPSQKILQVIEQYINGEIS
jgi:hypothetical protein